MRPIFLLWLIGALLLIQETASLTLPAKNFPAANGAVYALEATSSTLFIGGAFTEIGTPTGGAMELGSNSTEISTGFPKIKGHIISAIPDRGGGWYLGGEFTFVDGSEVENLVHITHEQTLDENFNPDPDGLVTSLALSPDGKILYAGGAFTSMGNQARNGLAAINTVNGSVLSFNPAPDQANLKALALSPEEKPFTSLETSPN